MEQAPSTSILFPGGTPNRTGSTLEGLATRKTALARGLRQQSMAFGGDESAFGDFLKQLGDQPAVLASPFLSRLLPIIAANRSKLQTGNTCFLRYPKDYIDSTTLADAAIYLDFVLANCERFDRFYSILSDEDSRRTAVEVTAFRILGGNRVRLSTNNSSYWRSVHQAVDLVKVASLMAAEFNGWNLDLFDLRRVGFDIDGCLAMPAGIAATFLRRQYEWHGADSLIAVRRGDIVIDAGAGWGDTALYFAHQSGERGRVFSFEILPWNLSIMEKNLCLNPRLRDRITVLPHALWNNSGEMVCLNERGPGSCLAPGMSHDRRVKTLTIDDFVEDQEIHRVDFIKMDIEGAEFQALQGSERTIKKFRPRLAICVYHKNEDVLTIPAYLNDLNLDYTFYLDHFTIYGEETILFAV